MDEAATRRALLASDVRLPEHVVYRSFATETVVLNLNTGRYHGLNPVAGRMLEVLEEAESVKEAASRLSSEYGQPLERIEGDLCDLCIDLSERGLIEVGGGEQG